MFAIGRRRRRNQILKEKMNEYVDVQVRVAKLDKENKELQAKIRKLELEKAELEGRLEELRHQKHVWRHTLNKV